MLKKALVVYSNPPTMKEGEWSRRNRKMLKLVDLGIKRNSVIGCRRKARCAIDGNRKNGDLWDSVGIRWWKS